MQRINLGEPYGISEMGRKNSIEKRPVKDEIRF